MSARLNASAVLMSGLAAPRRVATPTPVRARFVREPASSLFFLIKSSIKTRVKIATSKASPPSICFFRAAAASYLMMTLFSVERPNCGSNSSSSAAFKATVLSTLISAENKVIIKYDAAAALKKQIDGGEAFDVDILTPALIDDLIK